MKNKIVELNCSKVYGDILIQRGKVKRWYKWTAKREAIIATLCNLSGQFASSQVYTPKAEVKTMTMTAQRQRELLNEMVDAVLLSLDDKEAGHYDADEIMQKYLRELGHGRIADLYDKCEKWYS